MKKIIQKLFFAAFLPLVFVRNETAAQERLAVDVVFTIDLSGSTNGLVDDVRDHLWEFVNQAATYRPEISFRIGIVAFSRPSFGRENGYVKILCDLTDNYEIPAFELSKLKPSIEKGDQLVGMALKTSVLGMKWSTQNSSVKVIFLTGNGNVNLDGIKYKEAYEEAARRGIIINTVYCFSSNYKKEIFGWKEIAKQSGGEQFDMRVHQRNPLILTCTGHERLKKLSSQLSNTYVYYGKFGADIFKMVKAVDEVAAKANNMTLQSRLYYKISMQFQSRQDPWDLVDYIKKTNSDFTELNYTQLPDTLQKITPQELRKIVLQKKDERLRVISELRGLLKIDRQQIINREIAEKKYDDNPGTFDRIVISWMNKTLEQKGVRSLAR